MEFHFSQDRDLEDNHNPLCNTNLVFLRNKCLLVIIGGFFEGSNKGFTYKNLTVIKNECVYKDTSLYLSFEPAVKVLAQRDYLNYLSRKAWEMEGIMD